MGEEQESEAGSVFSRKQKSLELLFDYTKFHIGLYLTLTAAFIGVAKAGVLTLRAEWIFWSAVWAFVLAGLAGGVIASSITQTSTRNAAEFLESAIGPWNWDAFKARYWTWIEHTAFWIGLLFAVFTFKKA